MSSIECVADAQHEKTNASNITDVKRQDAQVKQFKRVKFALRVLQFAALGYTETDVRSLETLSHIAKIPACIECDGLKKQPRREVYKTVLEFVNAFAPL